MATKNGGAAVAAPAARGGKQVITLVTGFEETGGERLLQKVIPACVISGALHVAVAATFLLFGTMFETAGAKPPPPPPPLAVETAEDKPTPNDLTKEVESLISEQDTSIEVSRQAPVTIETPKVTEDPIGDPNTNTMLVQDSTATLGAPTENVIDPGSKIDLAGLGVTGTGGSAGVSVANPTLGGRSAATRDKMVTANGGTTGSQLAVGRGLAWLAKQQKADGTWEWDGTSRVDVAAATGLALLPFLAAGQTHKVADWKGEDGKTVIKYKEVVLKGLLALIQLQKPDGSFRKASGQYLYSHGIAALALCEAYGMTGDKTLLLRPAQLAVNFIMDAQGPDGSWGYQPKTTGDTSIVGWQVQALQSAKLCKDLVVSKRVMDKARSFLESVASPSSSKARYGYRNAGTATPTRTAIGLLCRYYLDGWGPNNPGMADGVAYLRTNGGEHSLPGKDKKFDMYYFYYASQVMHFHDGEVWKQWNGLMRDWLIDLQAKDVNDPKNYGSWDRDNGQWFGPHCGRVGTTCMALLTLEIYYRHTPLYKRDQGGLKELEGIGGK